MSATAVQSDCSVKIWNVQTHFAKHAQCSPDLRAIGTCCTDNTGTCSDG